MVACISSLEILPLQKVVKMIENQEIVDGKTICGIMVGMLKLKDLNDCKD
jgi:hypothetical protein